MDPEFCLWLVPGSTNGIRALSNAWASFGGVNLDLELGSCRSEALEWIKIGFYCVESHLLYLGGEIN